MKSDFPPGGLLPLHHEAAVEPVNSNQLAMGALLNDRTMIDHNNLVRICLLYTSVVVEELIPEMSQGKHSNIGTVFFAVGFSVMTVSYTHLRRGR